MSPLRACLRVLKYAVLCCLILIAVTVSARLVGLYDPGAMSEEEVRELADWAVFGAFSMEDSAGYVRLMERALDSETAQSDPEVRKSLEMARTSAVVIHLREQIEEREKLNDHAGAAKLRVEMAEEKYGDSPQDSNGWYVMHTLIAEHAVAAGLWEKAMQTHKALSGYYERLEVSDFKRLEQAEYMRFANIVRMSDAERANYLGLKKEVAEWPTDKPTDGQLFRASQVVDKLREICGVHSLDYLEALEQHGKLLMAARMPHESLDAYREAYLGYVEVFGEGHSRPRTSLKGYKAAIDWALEERLITGHEKAFPNAR